MSKQILSALLNCSWQWALLGGFIWLVASRLRRSNTTYHLLWLLSLISLPILFGLNQFMPAISIRVVQPELATTEPVVASLIHPPVPPLDLSVLENKGAAAHHPLTKGIFPSDWGLLDGLLCAWAIGVLVMLMRLLFGLHRIGQLRRTATIADGSYQAVCLQLAQQMNINRPVTVHFSDKVVSPISFGWLSPCILIPATLCLEQFKLVAAHELAHIQRLDWVTNLFSHLVGAIFFFHPLYHLFSRRLANLREQICDDWVIQLTGARKNYAQCLLDMVLHKDQSIPLALALNQPSQLESRIGSILKNNRRLDLRPKPRLRLAAITLLLSCLPLLAMAQLVPLRTVQLALFSETRTEKSEKAVDKAKMKGKSKYKERQTVRVLNPADFKKSQENPLFSGPQPGEKLPPFKAMGMTGALAGKAFDVIAEADGKPLVLFLQDDNIVGVKGLYIFAKMFAPIVDKVDGQLHTSVVFLSDDLTKLSETVADVVKFSELFQMGVSRDGREGPGAYGLNRNVAQTILVAKDGKVLHNFALTQPMLYPEPHVLGAIAHAIEVEPATLEKWLNEESAERYEKAELDEHTIAAHFAKLREAVVAEKISETEAAEWLDKLGITWEEGEALLKDTSSHHPTRKVPKDTRSRERDPVREGLMKRSDKDGDGKLNEAEGRAARKALVKELNENQEAVRKVLAEQEEGRPALKALVKELNENQEAARKVLAERRRARPNRYRGPRVEVKNPAAFKKTQREPLFSGPQPGEHLPPLKVTGLAREFDGKQFDPVALAEGKPQILFIQDESRLGGRHQLDLGRRLQRIMEASKTEWHMSVVYISDKREEVSKFAALIDRHLPAFVKVGYSKDGRDGPGSYGLNRNVSLTLIIAKEGKVTHNFAFPQCPVWTDPHVLGAIADVIGVKYETMTEWLKARPAESDRMEREGEGNGSDEAAALGAQLRELVRNGEITGEEARKRYEKAFPRRRQRDDK